MKIHEYQAKASWPSTAYLCRAARWRSPSKKPTARRRRLGGSVVVKAQIHAGGRGKGGGVKLAKDHAEAADASPGKILGMTLVTHQTGPEGRIVQRLLDRRDAADRARALSRHRARPRQSARPCSWLRPRAAWTSKRWRRKTPRADSRKRRSTRLGLIAVSGAQTRVRHRNSRGQRQRRGCRDDGARQSVRGDWMRRSPRSIRSC